MKMTLKNIIKNLFQELIISLLETERVYQVIKKIHLTEYLVHGNSEKLTIHPTAVVNNALFNVASGFIVIERNVFFGHNVSLLTGTHDISIKGEERKKAVPREGRDIIIYEGVWIASNATIIGPAVIGENSVIGACSLVLGNVEPNCFYAGVPAHFIKKL